MGGGTACLAHTLCVICCQSCGNLLMLKFFILLYGLVKFIETTFALLPLFRRTASSSSLLISFGGLAVYVTLAIATFALQLCIKSILALIDISTNCLANRMSLSSYPSSMCPAHFFPLGIIMFHIIMFHSIMFSLSLRIGCRKNTNERITNGTMAFAHLVMDW